MKKKISIATGVLALLLPLVLMLFTAFFSPVYDDSYYAALHKQWDRLNGVAGERVVLVGGSSVAFGTDCELFEELYHKPLVNVGLYGVYGTKMMMEASKSGIRAGDTVVLAPELIATSYSLEQNFVALWKSAERSPSLLSIANFDDTDKLIGSLLPYLTEKREYLLSGQKPQNEGVYSYASVNAYGEIKKGIRQGNIMRSGRDGDEILLDKSAISDEFISYVNDYVDDCARLGATVYFTFSPINDRALKKQGGENAQEKLSDVHSYLVRKLRCKVISEPCDHVFDYRYFYDTNFHLNDAGTAWQMVQLVKELKLAEGDYSRVEATLPTPPDMIERDVEIDENLAYTNSDLFVYEEDEEGLLTIVGVKQEAKALQEMILPVLHDGKYVYGVAKDALSGCLQLKKVDVAVGISELYAGAFNGCSSLQEVRVHHKNASELNVYDGTFTGAAPDCKIVLVNASKAEFLAQPEGDNGSGFYRWERVTLPIEEVKR